MIVSKRGRESKREKLLRAGRIVELLAKGYAKAECALTHDNPLQLLLATILSAQCTDVRVNMVTPELFRRFPDSRSLAMADTETVEFLVRTTGFYRNKAKHLIGACRVIEERFGGRVPESIDELLTLPGVARKTANVVLGTAFGQPSGVVVDTHVRRIAGLLGLTSSSNPVKIEQDLVRLIPRSEWIDFSHRLIWHGRQVCIARRPACGRCLLAPECPSADQDPG